jgi:hypothetical protein
MSSILKVDTIQTTAGAAPTAKDLGLNVTGNILNHSYTQYSSAATITLNTGNYVDSTLSLTVTPQSTSSKFIITYNVYIYLPARVNGWSAMAGRILRDSTVIHTDAYSLGRGAFYNSGAVYVHSMINSTDSYQDEPSTTSSITYKLEVASYQGTTMYLHQAGQKGFLTVTEIEG